MMSSIYCRSLPSYRFSYTVIELVLFTSKMVATSVQTLSKCTLKAMTKGNNISMLEWGLNRCAKPSVAPRKSDSHRSMVFFPTMECNSNFRSGTLEVEKKLFFEISVIILKWPQPINRIEMTTFHNTNYFNASMTIATISLLISIKRRLGGKNKLVAVGEIFDLPEVARWCDYHC